VLDTYLKWFKAHERFLIIVLAAVLVFHIWGSALQAWVDHDKRIATVADTQSQAAETALAQQVTVTNALNARIDGLMHQRALDTQKQIQIDNAAKASAVATRIADLLKVKPEEITATPDNTLILSNDAAHTDVNALEDLQQANADVLDLSTKLGACNVLSDRKDTALTTEKQAHVDDVKLEQAKTKKAFWHGFKWGAITGFIGGVALHLVG
jgi:hypothetical protein